MTLFKAITKSAFLVKVGGLGEFYFTEKSGGKVTSESADVPNGSGNKIFKITGPVKVENITLKAPFDPGLIGQIEPLVLQFSCQGTDLIIQPVDCQGRIGTVPDGTSTPIAGLPNDLIATPVGEAYIYKNARVVSYMPPDVDRKSGESSMIEIEFVADEMVRGRSYTGNGQQIGKGSASLIGLDRFLGSL
jgi:hypothetical protein